MSNSLFKVSLLYENPKIPKPGKSPRGAVNRLCLLVFKRDFFCPEEAYSLLIPSPRLTEKFFK